MTQQEWLKTNPNHRVLLENGTTLAVRAILYGGSGIDQRLIGEGDDANQAIEQALVVRQRMKDMLP